MMVVMDTGATIGVIGKKERGRAKNIRKGKPVRIRTAMGIVMKDMIGDLETSRGVLTGYLVDESEYSLWPVKEVLEEEWAAYVQTKHKAEVRHTDGRVDRYVPYTGLCVLMTNTVEAMQTSTLLHEMMGHADYDEKCKWCAMGRQRSR